MSVKYVLFSFFNPTKTDVSPKITMQPFKKVEIVLSALDYYVSILTFFPK